MRRVLYTKSERKSLPMETRFSDLHFLFTIMLTSVISDYAGVGSHFCRGFILTRTSNSTHAPRCIECRVGLSISFQTWEIPFRLKSSCGKC